MPLTDLMLDEHTFSGLPAGAGRARAAWLREQRPALLATAVFWLLFALLALLTLFTGWASRPATLLLQAGLSFGAGFLAAVFTRRATRQSLPRQGLPRQGALAGFYLPLTTAVVLTAIALAAGLASFGALLPLMLPYFVSLPVEAGLCSLLGAAGAWTFGRLVRS